VTGDIEVMPSVSLTAGGATATVHPAMGGRLGQLDLGFGPLLRSHAPDLGWDEWGCYPLVPWSNRLPGGRLRFGGVAADFPPNCADGSAIHGLVASRPWKVEASSGHAISLIVDVVDGPYRLRASLSYELEPRGLGVSLSVINTGIEPVPVGIGIHPWFRSATVSLPAERRWPGEPMPTGRPVPVEGRYDLRRGARPEPMDCCFTALTATTATIGELALTWEGPVTDVVVFSGVPGWVCVEPVTMANGAFGLSPDDAVAHGGRFLPPGKSLAVAYRFDALT
jgi:aldose 1-epimerase